MAVSCRSREIREAASLGLIGYTLKFCGPYTTRRNFVLHRAPHSTQVQGDDGAGERHRSALPRILPPTKAGLGGAVRGAVEAGGGTLITQFTTLDTMTRRTSFSGCPNPPVENSGL